MTELNHLLDAFDSLYMGLSFPHVFLSPDFYILILAQHDGFR